MQRSPFSVESRNLISMPALGVICDKDAVIARARTSSTHILIAIGRGSTVQLSPLVTRAGRNAQATAGAASVIKLVESEGTVTTLAIAAQDNAVPVVIIGTSSGQVVFATERGRVFAAAQLHTTPVLRICVDLLTPDIVRNPNTYRSATSVTRGSIEGISVIFAEGAVANFTRSVVKGMVGAAEAADKPSHAPPRPSLDDPESRAPVQFAACGDVLWLRVETLLNLQAMSQAASVADVAICSRLTPEPLEVLLPNFQSDRVFVTGGTQPGITGFVDRNENVQVTTAQVVSEVASKLSGAALGLVKGLWGSGNAKDGSKPAPKVVPLPTRPVAASTALMDGASYASTVHRLSIDPSQRWCACHDSHTGRVLLFDLTSGIVWRVFKGARLGEHAWLVLTDTSKASLVSPNDGSFPASSGLVDRRQEVLAIHYKLRGVIEFFSVRRRERLGAVKVGEGCKLLGADPLDPSLCLVATPDGSIKSLTLRPQATARPEARDGATAAGVSGTSAFSSMFGESADDADLKKIVEAAERNPAKCICAAEAAVGAAEEAWNTADAQLGLLDALASDLKEASSPINPNERTTIDDQSLAAIFSGDVKATVSRAQALHFIAVRREVVRVYFSTSRESVSTAMAPASTTPDAQSSGGDNSANASSSPSSSFFRSIFSSSPSAATDDLEDGTSVRSLRQRSFINAIRKAAGTAVTQEAFNAIAADTATDKRRDPNNNDDSTATTASGGDSAALQHCTLREFVSCFFCGSHKPRYLGQGSLPIEQRAKLGCRFFSTAGLRRGLAIHAKGYGNLGFSPAEGAEIAMLYLITAHRHCSTIGSELDTAQLAQLVSQLSESQWTSIVESSFMLEHPQRLLRGAALLLLHSGAHASPTSPLSLLSERAIWVARALHLTSTTGEADCEEPKKPPTSRGDLWAHIDELTPLAAFSSAPGEDAAVDQLFEGIGSSVFVRRANQLIADARAVVKSEKFELDDAFVQRLRAAAEPLEDLLASAVVVGPADKNSGDEPAPPKTPQDVERLVLAIAAIVAWARAILSPFADALTTFGPDDEFDVTHVRRSLCKRLRLTKVSGTSARRYLEACKGIVDLAGNAVAQYMVLSDMFAVEGALGSLSATVAMLADNDAELSSTTRPFPVLSAAFHEALSLLNVLCPEDDANALLMRVTDTCTVLDLCLLLDAHDGGFVPVTEWPPLFVESTISMLSSPGGVPSDTSLAAIDDARRGAIETFVTRCLRRGDSSGQEVAAAIHALLSTPPEDTVELAMFRHFVENGQHADTDRLLASQRIVSRQEAAAIALSAIQNRLAESWHFLRATEVAAKGSKVHLSVASSRLMTIEAAMGPELKAWLSRGTGSGRCTWLADALPEAPSPQVTTAIDATRQLALFVASEAPDEDDRTLAGNAVVMCNELTRHLAPR